jgi:hypothetical protein
MRTFLILCILSVIVAAAPEARADPKADARAVVEAHFTALADGDAAAAKALWSKSAKVTSYAADGTRTSQKVAQAIARWIEHPEGMSWKIDMVKTRADGTVVVRARVVWNGAAYVDVLQLKKRGGKLRLVAKQSSAVVPASERNSGY